MKQTHPPGSRLRLGGLARGTLAVLAWNLARLATQLIWVVLMARTLGVGGYGTFSGVAGFALAISGLAGVGLGLRLYRDVARSPVLLGVRWAQATRALTWSSALLWIGFMALGPVMFPDLPIGVLACIATAELIGTPIVLHVAFAYAAQGHVAHAAAIPVALSCARVLAVLALPAIASETDLATYVLLHAATTLICAGLLWRRCHRQLAPPVAPATLDGGALGEGAKLSAIWASGMALSSLDKFMALREGGADIAGQYTAASRLSSLVAAPIDALASAAMPRLFRAGGGHATSPHLLVMLFAAGLSYGALAGSLVWIGAGLLPWALGTEFSEAVPVLQVLAFVVPAYCLRIVGANVLLGFGWIRWRLAAETIALILIVALMAWWVPIWRAEGAALAVLVAESGLALALWVRIFNGANGAPGKRA
jgi:O-antigen/teichoic acid export membrane protein